MNLNIPETRQKLLEERLNQGSELVAAEVAEEFSVSLDTIRRDILALEAEGKAHRVRGGAVPVSKPLTLMHTRVFDADSNQQTLVQAALELVKDANTLLLDGGSTTLGLAQVLSPRSSLLVITPSPWIAVACQQNGVDVFMLGGRLSPMGGVNVGEATEIGINEIAADVSLIGACGLDAEFGLSSDDFDESRLKIAMHQSSRRTFVLTGRSKIGLRARHRTLRLDDIDLLITDAAEQQTQVFVERGLEVFHA